MQLSTKRLLRILDFDIETRLVGFYEAGRFKPKGSEPTAIAARFLDEPDHEYVWVFPEDTHEDMLEGFRVLYNQADIVTGHYITKFDLPILNGAMFENRRPLLGQKDVQDTKVHLRTIEGLSKSQENLAGMLEVAEQKHHMSDYLWRKATRLTPEGIEQARKRVSDDVVQHIALRQVLIEAEVLNPPELWRP